MTQSDLILVITTVASVVAIILAPIVALWIGGILQQRTTDHNAKLSLFSTLIGMRHDPLSADAIKSLNLIDAVFVHEPPVREAWTRYYTALSDGALNSPLGASIREERRRDLLLEMVKALGLTNKISSADLLRGYQPAAVVEAAYLAMVERMYKKAVYEEELRNRGIEVPSWTTQAPPAPQPTPSSTTPTPSAPQPAPSSATQAPSAPQPAPSSGNGKQNPGVV
jgi:hypothetical protein